MQILVTDFRISALLSLNFQLLLDSGKEISGQVSHSRYYEILVHQPRSYEILSMDRGLKFPRFFKKI